MESEDQSNKQGDNNDKKTKRNNWYAGIPTRKKHKMLEDKRVYMAGLRKDQMLDQSAHMNNSGKLNIN